MTPGGPTAAAAPAAWGPPMLSAEDIRQEVARQMAPLTAALEKILAEVEAARQAGPTALRPAPPTADEQARLAALAEDQIALRRAAADDRLAAIQARCAARLHSLATVKGSRR